MEDGKIQVEGHNLQEALRNACAELDLSGPHAVRYEFDREHFRNGADTVRITAWARDPKFVEATAYAEEFVHGFLDRFGVRERQLDIDEGDEKTILSMSVGDAGNILIGRDGKNLDALQYILTNAMNHRGIGHKVILDVEAYRTRREDNLRERAQEACDRVLSRREPLVIGPFNSYERRIVHMEVRRHGGLASASVGTGKLKKIEIRPA